jgi:hypothetical protein
MQCPRCNSRLHMYGGQFSTTGGKLITFGACLNKTCKLHGKDIKFYLREEQDEKDSLVRHGNDRA